MMESRLVSDTLVAGVTRTWCTSLNAASFKITSFCVIANESGSRNLSSENAGRSAVRVRMSPRRRNNVPTARRAADLRLTAAYTQHEINVKPSAKG